MPVKILLYLLVFLSGYTAANGQITNTGQQIFIGSGALVFVPEDFKTISGSVFNDGILKINGDWLNNDAASKVFDSRSTGKVILSGVDQSIGGTAVTAFPSLELAASGAVSLDQPTEIFGTLTLADKELFVKSHTLTLTNPQPGALSRTTGFVNTDQGGKLIRNTNAAAAYSFPLGSSAAGRFSPVVIEPVSNQPMSFSATLYNSSPSVNGFDLTNKRPDIETVSDKYFFLVDQVSGSDNAVYKFYSSAADGDVKQLVKWGSAATWERAVPSSYTDGSFGSSLVREFVYNAGQVIRNTAFTFAVPAENEILLSFYNAFSPNGDGMNDLWEIENIEMYPDNEVRIYNRSGDEVYSAKGYTSIKGWDGGTLNTGTYYYVVTVNINGATKNFRGFITMLK